MALPSAVQAQVENAERIQALIAGQAADAEGGESPAAQAPQPAVPSQPEAPTTTQPEAVVAVAPADDPNSETWKQRFRSLQGVFNAEMPKLQRANAAQEDQIKTLTEQVAALMAKPPAQEVPASSKTLVTPADVESFGAELIDLMRRVSKEIVGDGSAGVAREVELLKAEVAKIHGQLGTVSESVVVSAQDRFLSAMTALVPDWKDIDEQQGWLDWLAQVDPMVGKTRQALLIEATTNRDAERVAAFFNAYKSVVTPAVARQTSARQEQQRQVAPPRTRTAAPTPNNGADRIFTGKDIQAGYDAIRMGQLTGDAAVQWEAQLTAAMEAGRIAP